ncbi:c-type cytochrome [Verrucomicrobiaceae bacterium R5-34]|nr:c-type cytochrome [Verrucomicrobiaceae bacterium R5-34]
MNLIAPYLRPLNTSLQMISHKNVLILGLSLITASSPAVFGQKKMLSQRKQAFSPEQQLKQFQLPEGFVIELVASEKNGLINPIDLTFDDAGRLWTQTARMYPLDPVTGIRFSQALKMMKDPNLAEKFPRVAEIQQLYKLEKKGRDQILIVDDPTETADGPLKVWADGLSIPQSIYPYKNGCFVAHGSEFLYLKDSDNDGKQDEFESVMSGFGFFDTHTMAHSIVRGPGGWLYFTHGALNSGKVKVTKTGQELEVSYAKNLRAKLDGSKLEIIGTAKDNVWGYQIRSNGQWYSTSANDNGLSVLPTEEQTGISGIGGDSIRPYQPLLDKVHKFRVGGTGISGLAFSEDGAYGFPKEWKNVAFLANPITNGISCVRIDRLPSGEVKAELLPDFLKCEDDWFRPVNIEFGPDGCLYIADWYNKVVSHNEISTDHPDRDRKHGRIWRIRHKDQKTFEIPNIAKVANQDLLKHLNGRTLWEKRAAWQQIVDRQATELTPELKKLALDRSIDQSVRILAIWSLEGLNQYDESVLKQLIADQDGDIVREAIRTLSNSSLPAAKVAELIGGQIESENAMVRSQSIRTLEEIGKADLNSIDLLVTACKPAAPGKSFGGAYERNFERFLARKALENYPSELVQYLATDAAKKQPAGNVLWAIQALPAQQRVDVFVKVWDQATQGEIDQNTFIAVSKMLNNPKVLATVQTTFDKRADELLPMAIANKSMIDGPAVSQFYQKKIAALFNSGDEQQQREALKLVNDLRAPHHLKSITKILGSKSKSSLHQAAIEAVLHSKGNHAELYQAVAADPAYDFEVRLHAAAALCISDGKAARGVVAKMVDELNDAQKSQLVRRLSFSKQGNNVLFPLWNQKKITPKHWDYPSAARVAQLQKRNKTAKAIYAAMKKQEMADRKKLTEKAEHYAKVVDQLKGNPMVGQGLFGSCLACHAVGDQGQKIAPPLDGSASRDTEHLLTAIVNPDEAMESAFGLYFATRKDGLGVEGYLAKRDDNGIVIAIPGGAEVFIARSSLIADGAINGRSFMPRGFGELPDQTMADLLAYIKTLK